MTNGMPLQSSSENEEVPTTAREQPLITVGADVDASALVEEILTEVARKMREGLYPADLMADIEVAMDPLESALEDVRRAAKLSFQPPASSARRTLGVPAAVVKRGFRLALRWYTQWMVAQFSMFASSVVALATGLNARLKQHEQRLDQLSRELAEESARIRVEMKGLSRAMVNSDPLVKTGERPVNDGPEAGRTVQVHRTTDHVGVEDRFRGSEAEVAPEPSRYVDLFRQAPGPVVDIGGGRGEFLAVLAGAGVQAYGVGINADMASRCRQQGLDVRQEDAISHLRSVPPASLGGIFSCQVVEHLGRGSIVRLFQVAAEALAEGGVLVVETISPKPLMTYASTPHADHGHLRVIHPDVLVFLAECVGLHNVEIRYSTNPKPKRLRQVKSAADPAIQELVVELNENFCRIDDLLSGRLGFTVIARR